MSDEIPTSVSAYAADTPPPWVIGRPQGAIAKLIEDGCFSGRVLDLGCGMGEHTMLLAAKGIEVVGIDPSDIAIGKAKAEASRRGLRVDFRVGNDMDIAALGRFDCILDSGVFHIFDDERRAQYVANIESVIADGGLYVCLVFSDLEPPGWGPRRIHKAEFATSFSNGWQVESVEPSIYENTFKSEGARAHLAKMRRAPS